MHQTPNLLLITENPSMIGWFKSHLEDDYYLILAKNRQNGLNILITTELQSILIDSQMEGPPFPLCHEIRSRNTTVPILLITGRLKQKYRDEALRAGVSDFLNGNLNFQEVISKLNEGVKAAESRKKTDKLSSQIPHPPFFSPIFNRQVMEQLTGSKNSGTFLQIMLIKWDHPPKEGVPPFVNQLISLIVPLLNPSVSLIPTTDGDLLLLFSDTTEQEAFEKADEILKKIEKHPFKSAEGYSKLTASIALSSTRGDQEEFYQIIQLAGKYLQKGKSTTNKIISLPKDFL